MKLSWSASPSEDLVGTDSQIGISALTTTIPLPALLLIVARFFSSLLVAFYLDGEMRLSSGWSWSIRNPSKSCSNSWPAPPPAAEDDKPEIFCISRILLPKHLFRTYRKLLLGVVRHGFLLKIGTKDKSRELSNEVQKNVDTVSGKKSPRDAHHN